MWNQPKQRQEAVENFLQKAKKLKERITTGKNNPIFFLRLEFICTHTQTH